MKLNRATVMRSKDTDHCEMSKRIKRRMRVCVRLLAAHETNEKRERHDSVDKHRSATITRCNSIWGRSKCAVIDSESRRKNETVGRASRAFSQFWTTRRGRRHFLVRSLISSSAARPFEREREKKLLVSTAAESRRSHVSIFVFDFIRAHLNQ